ncbi:hypothetical protein BaRGS_00033593 [Batillaria attramentaria]|uniref:Uncharacterized protein n=1 Tax=Batillaria attramentaria TaxID=370345 RepID=A0ABD0JJM2_9CAEN
MPSAAFLHSPLDTFTAKRFLQYTCGQKRFGSMVTSAAPGPTESYTSSLDALPSLLEKLEKDTTPADREKHLGKLIELVDERFCNFSLIAESVRVPLVQHGVVPPLLDLLKAPNTSISIATQVCRALGNICFDNDVGRTAVNEGDGISKLLELLQKNITNTQDGAAKLRVIACGFILNLTNECGQLLVKPSWPWGVPYCTCCVSSSTLSGLAAATGRLGDSTPLGLQPDQAGAAVCTRNIYTKYNTNAQTERKEKVSNFLAVADISSCQCMSSSNELNAVGLSDQSSCPRPLVREPNNTGRLRLCEPGWDSKVAAPPYGGIMIYSCLLSVLSSVTDRRTVKV